MHHFNTIRRLPNLSNDCMAQQLWNKLAATYSQIFESRFQNISKRSMFVLEYLGCINEVSNQLSDTENIDKEKVAGWE